MKQDDTFIKKPVAIRIKSINEIYCERNYIEDLDVLMAIREGLEERVYSTQEVAKMDRVTLMEALKDIQDAYVAIRNDYLKTDEKINRHCVENEELFVENEELKEQISELKDQIEKLKISEAELREAAEPIDEAYKWFALDIADLFGFEEESTRAAIKEGYSEELTRDLTDYTRLIAKRAESTRNTLVYRDKMRNREVVPARHKQLDDKELRELYSRGLSPHQIYILLNEKGIEVSNQTIINHLKAMGIYKGRNNSRQ